MFVYILVYLSILMAEVVTPSRASPGDEALHHFMWAAGPSFPSWTDLRQETTNHKWVSGTFDTPFEKLLPLTLVQKYITRKLRGFHLQILPRSIPSFEIAGALAGWWVHHPLKTPKIGQSTGSHVYRVEHTPTHSYTHTYIYIYTDVKITMHMHKKNH